MIEWSKYEEGECGTIEEVPKGAIILSVDDIECYGMCEVCGKPILNGEAYWNDSEGVMWHKLHDAPNAIVTGSKQPEKGLE